MFAVAALEGSLLQNSQPLVLFEDDLMKCTCAVISDAIAANTGNKKGEAITNTGRGVVIREVRRRT